MGDTGFTDEQAAEWRDAESAINLLPHASAGAPALISDGLSPPAFIISEGPSALLA